MNTNELQQIAIAAIEDLKGTDIVSYDVHELTTITDVMIICTGRSTRHTASIAQNIVTAAKAQQVKNIRMEGDKEGGEWVIVDLGDVIVHVMIAETRAFYHLEDLWAPIKELREHKRSC